MLHYPGQALYALLRSQQRNPAPWKIDLVRKALAYYQPWWRQNKAMAFVPWQTAAFTEAYLLTHEKPFADCVYEMNDWLVALQYQQLDPLHRLWLGGFKSWSAGRSADTSPRIETALFVESLAQASRVAREAPVDVARHKRYTEAVEHGLQFIATLQYTEGNTLHFVEPYRRAAGGRLPPVAPGWPAPHRLHPDGAIGPGGVSGIRGARGWRCFPLAGGK